MTATCLRIVVLGLSLSSSWGNGHATTYRSLLRALAAHGHDVLFLERDVPWYAAHRDLVAPAFCELAFYSRLEGLTVWSDRVASADVVIVGSYVPDGIAVCDLVLAKARGITAFYDIDTPVTVAALQRQACAYVDRQQVPRFDLYLSFTGGPMLDRIERELGARAARALYCSVDPDIYRPSRDGAGRERPRWDLAYLGTYAEDRQPALEELLLEPARRLPDRRFAVAGAQYPSRIAWPANVERVEHVPPAQHPRFFGACRATLNVTRGDMCRAGWSPSVRLFEAAACGTPIVSDGWPGLGSILESGQEIVVARTAADVVELLETWGDAELRRLAARARDRVLAAHTALHRARELERHIARARRGGAQEADDARTQSTADAPDPPATMSSTTALDVRSPTASRRHASERTG